MYAGIRIFDPMLFENTVVSKIMEDFNTKCYVMNNEKKVFSIKTILRNFVFINEENKSKEIQGKNVYLQNLFWGVFGLGFFFQGAFVWGFFVLIPSKSLNRQLQILVWDCRFLTGGCEF